MATRQNSPSTGASVQAGRNAGHEITPTVDVTALARSALSRLAHVRNNLQSPGISISPATIEAFCAFLLDADAEGATDMVRNLTASGTPYEQVADTLLAEAARRLGWQWETDALSFIDVSLGISTLLRVNSGLRIGAPKRQLHKEGLVHFVTLDKQAHTLGIILAAEAFRQHGWDVEMILAATQGVIVEQVSQSQSFIVGLTAGRHDSLRDIAALIASLKALPCAPRILLGGSAATARPELYNPIGADVIVSSIDGALAAARILN